MQSGYVRERTRAEFLECMGASEAEWSAASAQARQLISGTDELVSSPALREHMRAATAEKLQAWRASEPERLQQSLEARAAAGTLTAQGGAGGDSWAASQQAYMADVPAPPPPPGCFDEGMIVPPFPVKATPQAEAVIRFQSEQGGEFTMAPAAAGAASTARQHSIWSDD